MSTHTHTHYILTDTHTTLCWHIVMRACTSMPHTHTHTHTLRHSQCLMAFSCPFITCIVNRLNVYFTVDNLLSFFCLCLSLSRSRSLCLSLSLSVFPFLFALPLIFQLKQLRLKCSPKELLLESNRRIVLKQVQFAPTLLPEVQALFVFHYSSENTHTRTHTHSHWP